MQTPARVPATLPAVPAVGTAGAPGLGPLGPPGQNGQPVARTWLELANSNAPNAPHARALIQDRVAVYTVYSMFLEALLEQLGQPPVPLYTRADAIRAQLHLK